MEKALKEKDRGHKIGFVVIFSSFNPVIRHRIRSPVADPVAPSASGSHPTPTTTPFPDRTGPRSRSPVLYRSQFVKSFGEFLSTNKKHKKSSFKFF